MTRKNFKPAIKAYLLTVLADADHGIVNPTEYDLIKYAKDRFYSEYKFRVIQVGLQKAMIDWLQGLAINIEFYYCDIEKLLLSWGVINGSESELVMGKQLDLYWSRVAVNLLEMFNTVSGDLK